MFFDKEFKFHAIVLAAIGFACVAASLLAQLASQLEQLGGSGFYH